MSPKHFLNFQKITKQELVSIIDRGLELKKSVKPKKTLKNKVLGLVFEQPSTRTRVSFEVGMLRLGGNSLFLSGNELQLSRGEPISDTAKVLSSMLDVIVLRTDDQEKLNIFSQNSSVPLINGLSDLYHPCQIYPPRAVRHCTLDTRIFQTTIPPPPHMVPPSVFRSGILR